VRLQKEHTVNLEIRLKSFESTLLARGVPQVVALARIFGMVCTARAGLPTRSRHMTVLRSPHVHKKSREQFVLRTYKMVLVFGSQGDHHGFLAALKTLRVLGVQLHMTLVQRSFLHFSPSLSAHSRTFPYNEEGLSTFLNVESRPDGQKKKKGEKKEGRPL